MIKIDPLLFLFLMEFLFIFLFSCIFLYKNRGTGGGVSKGEDHFEWYLENEKTQLEKGLEKFMDEGKAGKDVEAQTEKEMHLIKLQFAEMALTGYRKCEGDIEEFWRNHFNHFTDLLKSLILRIKRLELEITQAPAPAQVQAAPPAQMDDDMDLSETVAISDTLEVTNSEEFQKMQGQIKALEDEVHGLRKELKVKEEEYNRLKENYDTLDMEYINLYKEHKGETGWTSAMHGEDE